jgi:hypothetical protein
MVYAFAVADGAVAAHSAIPAMRHDSPFVLNFTPTGMVPPPDDSPARTTLATTLQLVRNPVDPPDGA